MSKSKDEEGEEGGNREKRKEDSTDGQWRGLSLNKV